ncbi:MAG TPA: OsmC family protein [Blastocatellia bacterium]|nr:OsmC family protein [Blastocatellia bacterium]
MSHQLPYFYETDVEWAAGRKAGLRSSGLPPLQIAPPPEFQGDAGLWTPEHLYVASVNACFVITFLAIADLSKLDFVSFASNARGKLEKMEPSGYQITEIVLRPKLIVRNSRDLERAGRLLDKAEKNCLISNSIKTIVKLEPEINSETPDVLVA